MGELNVTFWGICTYIRDFRRFVLINAAEGEHVAPGEIAGHHARLHIHGEDVLGFGPLPVADQVAGMLRLKLEQVRLYVANPVLPSAVDASGNTCVTHLSDYTNGQPLGMPSYASVVGNDTIAAFFDVVQGTLVGYRKVPPPSDPPPPEPPEGACVNVLMTQTIGDPVLIIAPFNGSNPMTITLRDNASILITNLPEIPGEDKDFDFLLNFRVCATPPTDPQFPPPGQPFSGCCPSSNIEDGGIELYVGPGCSNTNYP